MPITRCPGCDQSLEVPATVPGGLVACPYCGQEFSPSGGGGGKARRRPAARGGGGRRGPGRQDEYYDDDRGGGRTYRRKKDVMPIVVAIVAVVVLGGTAAFFLGKKKVQEQEHRQAFYAKVAATPGISFPLPPTPPPPDSARPPFDLPTVYKENDLVTLMELSHSSGINYPKNDPEAERGAFPGFSYAFKTEEHGERVTKVEGTKSTHEGHYIVQSYVVGTQVLTNLTIDATFQMNRNGTLVPGTFRQTGGTTLSPLPEFLGDRSLGALPNKPVLLYEVWGTESLQNPLARNLLIEGRSLESIAANRQRVGGWRIATGTLETRTDKTWTHKAAIDLRLNAVENGVVRNFTFKGGPAELTFATKWTGEGEYLLQKQNLVRVGNLKTVLEVRIKTQTDVYDWIGQSMTNFKMYKDP